jgi:hypothetical protein
MSDKAEKKINESELTDLVLKLNQEQLNLKKKVERRDAEITRMKQTMAEKEEEW